MTCESELMKLGQNARRISLATDDYLSHHATSVEIALLVDVQLSLKNANVDSTYNKALPKLNDEVERVQQGNTTSMAYFQQNIVQHLLKIKPQGGALLKHPLLVMMRNNLPATVGLPLTMNHLHLHTRMASMTIHLLRIFLSILIRDTQTFTYTDSSSPWWEFVG